MVKEKLERTLSALSGMLIFNDTFFYSEYHSPREVLLDLFGAFPPMLWVPSLFCQFGFEKWMRVSIISIVDILIYVWYFCFESIYIFSHQHELIENP